MSNQLPRLLTRLCVAITFIIATSVAALAQTPDGYLWIGTLSGLIRFDGVSFTTYTRGNTPALISDAAVRTKTKLGLTTGRGTSVTVTVPVFRFCRTCFN